MSTKSNTIVYKNGDFLNPDPVKEVLFRFWQLTEAEKRAIRRMMEKYSTCPDKYLPLLKEWEGRI